MTIRLASWLALLPLLVLQAQQVSDPDFAPPIPRPAYAPGSGPTVLIDEAHFNFHTASGRYKPFADLLTRDGYVVKASTATLSADALAPAAVLVISNALAEQNRQNWSLPTPSAFTDEEITATRDWVENGGSLLLIADHMPFAGAAAPLAAAFGIEFRNGFVTTSDGQMGTITFQRSAGTLKDHAITQGRDASERVDRVATFTGSAFRASGDAAPLLVLPSGAVAMEPSVAWKFADDTPHTDVSGWLQGAVLSFGKGRIAVFGEAAMFSAQLAGPQRTRMGMNSPEAPHNAQFLLNVLHWLTRTLQ